MTRRAGGFTIIEVMIVLAVSGMLLITAILALRGQSGRTQFALSMRDIQSKFESIINDVNGGVFPSTEKYNCVSNNPPTTRPVLQPNPQNRGTSTDCTYLGKAIEPVINQDKMFVYTVLGNRLMIIPFSTGPIPVDSLDNAKATPAFNQTNGVSLTETYEFPDGATQILSSKVQGVPYPQSYLIGFYSSLQNASAAVGQNGSQSVVGKAYDLQSWQNVDIIDSGEVQACVEEGVTCQNTPEGFAEWDLCFASGDQKAVLKVRPNDTGYSTELSFEDCT